MIDNLPEYVKLNNAYNPAHYPANKKISAEEWNALWLSVMYQGNHQEDILASILNGTLPEIITEVNRQAEQVQICKEHVEDETIHLNGEQIERIADVPNKQYKIDNELITANKAVVGAINHLETERIAIQAAVDEIESNINYMFSTDNVVHVSNQKGSDTTGNGSLNKPYKTLSKATVEVVSKLGTGITRAAINIQDADIYYESVVVPNRVYLLAQQATIVGQITIGNNCYVQIGRHYPSASNQVFLYKSGTEVSIYDCSISDGRGINGNLTGTTNMSNTTSSSILFAHIRMLRIAANGFGCRDTSSDWGHFHLNVNDFYLDSNAIGLYANSSNSYYVGYIDHILKMADSVNTKAIYMTGATQVISLFCSEVKTDIAYEILLNPADATKGLFLNCLSVHGTKLGPGKPSKDASVFTNNYNELVNTPTKVSDFTNDSQFQSLVEVDALISAHNTSLINHSDIRAKLINDFTYDDVNKILSLSYADTSTKHVTLPVSSTTLDGLMPKGTLDTIANVLARVTYLENAGIWRGSFATLADRPLYTPNPAFVLGMVNINDYVDINNDVDHGDLPTRYRVSTIDESTGAITYQFITILTATLNLATNDIPGLFKGDDTDGKVFAEIDGSGSVVGWDTLKGRVTAVETNKVDKVSGYGLSENDLSNTLKAQYDDAYTKRHEHDNKDLLDTYNQTNANITDAINEKHSHDNKGLLDLTTESFTTELKADYDTAVATKVFSRVYKAITDLTGITASSTLAQVCDAMADNSYLNISTSGYANLVPTGETDLNGQLEIIKVNANRVRLAWSYQNASRQPIYYATYRNTGGFLGWKRLITDSEAQTITGMKNFNYGAIKISINSANNDYRIPLTSPSTTSTEKRYILGVPSSQSPYSSYNLNAYMQNGKLYSNDSEVVNLADDQTISGVKTFSNKIIGNLQGNADSSTLCSRLKGVDTRDTNETPEWYYTGQSVNSRTFLSEFKTSSVLGLSGSTYCLLLTCVPWGDATGGLPSQTAYLSNGEKYNRYGTTATTWSAWRREVNFSNLAEALAALGTV